MSRPQAHLVTLPAQAGREARLKLVLLSVALVLVVAYACAVTAMGDMLWATVAEVLSSSLSLLVLGALAGLAVLAGVAVLVTRFAMVRVEAAGEVPGPMQGRKPFLATLAGHLDASGRGSRHVALHLVDIDRFAVLNDALGEEAGDSFLEQVGDRLTSLVDQPGAIARVGDDEFALLQLDVGDARNAEAFARRVQEILKEATAGVPRHARPGISVGVALAPEHGGTPAALLRAATLALGAAKTGGGACQRLYEREMDTGLATRLTMEKAISDGLHQGWFHLVYQPQYDLRSRRLTGFEALVRMNHPALGLLLPDAFIPVANDSGLIQPLGEWIVREAVAVAAEWPPHLQLALNLSFEQLRDGDVAALLLHRLAHAGVDPARLTVEIPEAVLLDRFEAVNAQLRTLKERGVTIVVDDFGLDMSRLQLLSQSACDAVKIDRTLTARVGLEPEAEVLVGSLVGTAQSFDLDVMAEGIERPEQVRFLASQRCYQVQGTLFGGPAVVADLGAILARDTRNAIIPHAVTQTARPSGQAVAH